MQNKRQDNHKLNSSILRAYDIRGTVGETLTEEGAYYIGRGFASHIIESGKGKTICVGFDGRESSPSLEENLVSGMKSSGADVIRIGVGPTPMLYFAVRHFKAAGGIMITGSHNPPSYNGFKLMLDKLPFYGDDIIKLGKRIEDGDFQNGSGSVCFESVEGEYLEKLLSAYSVNNDKSLKVAWDPGNGSAGDIVTALTSKLPGQHILINEKIDGSFPAHHPDPTKEENLKQLIDVVKNENCDLGIALDGDGDRIGAVDNHGRIIWGDQLMTLLARDLLKSNPGSTIIADVKASQVLFDEVKKSGGNPIIWKTGHSHIKVKMAKEKAALAGEMSGHIFFADNNGFDDGVYAAIKLINVVLSGDKSLSQLLDSIPNAFNTPEIRIEVREEIKFEIVQNITNELKGSELNVNDIDGVRASDEKGWWLIRASNTESALVARCEASDPESLDVLQLELSKILSRHGVEWKS